MKRHDCYDSSQGGFSYAERKPVKIVTITTFQLRIADNAIPVGYR